MGRLGTCVLTFLDDMMYYNDGYNTVLNNSDWKRGLGSYSRKFLTEIVQNLAIIILDNSGGYTSLVIMSQ